MEVNVHHAKTHLSKLIAAAEAGEEVIIARNGKPAVKLVLAVPPEVEPRATKLPDRVFGRLAGKLILPPNWEEEWAEFDREIADLMINGPISNDELPDGEPR